jgi:hypothetical protein
VARTRRPARSRNDGRGRSYGDLVAPSFDGRFGYLLKQPFGSIPVSIDLLDLATGERTPWRRLQVPDSTGVTWIEPLQMFRRTTDAYAYGYTRNLQDLYLLEGLRSPRR